MPQLRNYIHAEAESRAMTSQAELMAYVNDWRSSRGLGAL